MVLLDGEMLKIEDVVAVARQGADVELTAEARSRVLRSRAAVERLLAEGQVVYGVTTGFGHFKDQLIPPDQVAQLQRNLLRSHAVGVGEPLAAEVVRAMMLIRANTLAKGYSGVREETIDALLGLLRAGVHPVIPAQGSLGASGDLAPLAHLALVLIGEGEAFYQDQRFPGNVALERAGQPPLTLGAKEGLALLNGTTQMAATGALVTYDAENLIEVADIAGALSLEALEGVTTPFDPRLHAVRPHPRQVDCAAHMRQLLAGSELVRAEGSDPQRVQDAYSLRCIPQVHGAVRDAVLYARWVVEIELNAASDNPLIFWEADQPVALSGGNFHGELVALAMDYLAMALTELGNISERRLNRLIDEDINDGLLPPFLIKHGGLNSGFMLTQYTAAALASENKVLAHPASADTIPTSANTEDHVSMGATAARKAQQVVKNVENILAIELLAAAQAIDFRRERAGRALHSGRGTEPVYQAIRNQVPFLEHDTVMAPLIASVQQLVASGELVEVSRRAVHAVTPAG
jgi:histidine ammonia-lyase